MTPTHTRANNIWCKSTDSTDKKEYPPGQTPERISYPCKKNWIEFESRLRAKQ